jgi:hypothetical protein
MSTRRGDRADAVLRTAAWFYLAPCIAGLVLVLGAVSLGAVLVLLALILALLERLGA